jgi:ankyrin repeat protein
MNASPLFRAAAAGKLEQVQSLISEGAEVDERTRGETPLLAAVRCGHADIVALLVKARADPLGHDMLETYRMQPEKGPTRPFRTLLHDAAYFNQPAVIVTLLKSGFDRSSADAYGATALQWAATYGKSDALDALVGGAPAKELNEALRGAQCALVPALLRAGASASPELLARMIGLGADLGIIDELLSHAVPANSTSEGLTQLAWAAKYGRLSIVERLLEHGADPNDRGESESAIYWAAATSTDSEKIVCRLLDSGADGSAALVVAAHLGRELLVELLLNRGTSASIQLVQGQRNHGYFPILGDGTTPLHEAVACGHSAIVQRLLSAGAPAMARDSRGRLAYALTNDLKILALLREHGGAPPKNAAREPQGSIGGEKVANQDPLHAGTRMRHQRFAVKRADDDDDAEWVEAMLVKHPKFGEGVVEKVEEVGNEAKLTIRFAVGTKTLLAKFVTLHPR